jgi:predicted RND superfamily exporter protein
MDAEFTATSMIGFIALAGIIVRNSILLVDFARESVVNGESVLEAVIHSCEARTRPIIITALALFGGSMVILSDPIFQGMAVSLIFGGAVATLLTLVVIPLGCISAGKVMGGGNDVDSDNDSPNSPSNKGSGNVVKSIGLFSMMYIVALIKSLAEGIVGWFNAGYKLVKKKTKATNAPNNATAKTVKAVAPKVSKPVEHVPTVALAKPAVETIQESTPADEVEVSTEAVVSVEAPATEQPTIEASEESITAELPSTPAPVEEGKERKKPNSRRGIKLKTDI